MRFCNLASAFCLLTSVAFALPEPGFDPKDVVRQVRSTHSTPGPLESLNPAIDDGEFLIDTSGVHGEYYPDLAFDGTNFLVVWQDGRSGAEPDIYGARVSQAGTVLGPTGIAISTAAYWQSSPAVAFDGTNFLVVWEDDRSGSDCDIYGTRVTPAGTVLDPSGFVISQAASAQFSPVLAFDGTNFLVVWADWRSGTTSDIYGARVTPAGVALDTSGIAISTAADDQWYAALALDGENLLVVWHDYRNNPDTSDVYGARVTPAGVVLDPAGIPISTAVSFQATPALAFDGENFLVAWTDCRGDGYNDIYGTLVTQGGVVLDSAGIAISTAAVYQEYPAVAFDGTNFLVVWEDSRDGSHYYDIYGARVTPGAVVLDSGPVVMQDSSQVYPKLAHGSGSQTFLVYQGWAGSVGGRTYDAIRVWGKMNPSPAVAEMTKPEVRRTNNGATIVSGVLFVPLASGVERETSSVLLDISGRKVLDLRSGSNDVRRLSPGVYFVRQAQTQVIRKVVIAG